jgi:hypothetical protein
MTDGGGPGPGPGPHGDDAGRRGPGRGAPEGYPETWRARHPVLAGALVALATYLLFALTLSVFGEADPRQALGPVTIGMALAMWFIAWAVFTRHRSDEGHPTDGGDGTDAR